MGSRDHSITCKTCGLQRGGLNDYKCHCDGKPPLVAVTVFDKHFARAAVTLCDAGQMSVLVVAGQLPGAVDRIDALEDACRGCLDIIDGVEQPGTTLQAIEAVLRAALPQDNLEMKT